MSSPISGKEVVTWAGFAALLPYSGVSIFLSNTDWSPSQVPMRLAIALAGQLIVFAVLVPWRWAASRRPGLAVTSTRSVLAFAVASAVRAAAVGYFFELAGFTHGVDWPRRLSGPVIGFTVALAVLDIVLGSVRRHRARVELLQQRQAAALAARTAALETMAEERDAAVADIRAQFSLRTEQLAASDPQVALDSIRATVSDLLRPMSQELAAQPSWQPPSVPARVSPSFELRSFLHDAAGQRPLNPTWVAVLFIAFGGPFLIAELPTGYALLLLVTAFIAIWLLLWIANAVFDRLVVTRSLAIRVLTLFALALAAGLLLSASSLVLVQGSEPVVVRVMIGDVVLLVTIAMALVAARAAAAQERSIEDQLERTAADLDWATTRARCVQWRQHRALARALHGPVQSAVNAAAMRLERAMAAGTVDDDFLDSLRSQLVGALEHLDNRDGRADLLEATLTEYAETWAGVCDITWHVDICAQSAMAADPIAAFAITELAAEATWNAIRHAHATGVDIEVGCAGSRDLGFAVRDDGRPTQSGSDAAARGPEDGRRRGLGTAMFDDMTQSWHRTRQGDVTVVEAIVPMQGRE